MQEALLLNGVFRTVLDEIVAAQKKDSKLICYLQPYSSRFIRLLTDNPPSLAKRVHLYISTTDNLSNICYVADIVGWESKKDVSVGKLNLLNAHIAKHQPEEKEKIYMTGGKGQDCVNLISVAHMKKIPNPYSVSKLVKRDGSPVRERTRAGGWCYVHELPTSVT